MLIARNGKVGFTRTLGDLGPDGPAMPLDAIFRIYSMTKPIVSVAAMMLVEEGRMLITDPLSEYHPRLRRDEGRGGERRQARSRSAQDGRLRSRI